jgi:general secretion pathway protein J
MSVAPRAWLDQSGFTLFEALVSVAVVSIIIFALGNVTSQWLPSWRYGLGRVQQTYLLSLGLQRMADDISASNFISPYRNAKEPLFEGSESSIVLVRNAIGPNSRPGLEVIRLAETSEGANFALIRTRAPFTPLPDGLLVSPHFQFSDPIVLIHPPYRISFSYAGSDGVWRDVWHRSYQLPSAVRILVRDSITNRMLSASTATLLHVNISPECVGQKSVRDCADGSLGSPPADQKQ